MPSCSQKTEHPLASNTMLDYSQKKPALPRMTKNCHQTLTRDSNGGPYSNFFITHRRIKTLSGEAGGIYSSKNEQYLVYIDQ